MLLFELDSRMEWQVGVLLVLGVASLLLLCHQPASSTAAVEGAAPQLSRAAEHPSSIHGGVASGNQTNAAAEGAATKPVDDALGGDASAWWFMPPASAAEATLIETLTPMSDIDRIAMLRQLRALGQGASAADLQSRWAEVQAWRRSHLSAAARKGVGTVRSPMSAPVSSGGLGASEGLEWPSAAEVEHGEWALQYLSIGLRCGRARGGHPVKLERLGRAQTERLEAETGEAGERRLAHFYYALIESMQHALDAESAASGMLLATYEVFDVSGMRLSQASAVTLRFARTMVAVFSRMYAETTCKVAIINLPWALRWPLKLVLDVLPPRTRARVHVLGGAWEDVLARDLDDEAMRWLGAEGGRSGAIGARG